MSERTGRTLSAHSLRLWLNAAVLALAALGMVAALALALRTVEAERSQRDVVERTAVTLEQLDRLSSQLLDAETGQRGYMLSLDPRYLAPYEDGRSRIDATLAGLRASIARDGTAEHRRLLGEIETLARAKFAEMDRGVALTRAGDRNEALRQLLSDEGQTEMEGLRKLFAQVEAIEARQLAEATRRAERAEGRMVPLLAAVFVLLGVALFAAVRLIARSVAAEVEAAQAPVLEAARDRADTLAKELNHRVKNLFAVVLAIVKLTARNEPEAKAVTGRIADRIYALLKAHEVTQGEVDNPTVTLAALVETTLAPYRSDDHPATVEGPEVVLQAQRITPLGLTLHELTTNAVKYGGWSLPGGALAVTWRVEGGNVALTWRETGAPITEPVTRSGFGSALMTTSARQLGGTVERDFGPDGVVVSLVFPLH